MSARNILGAALLAGAIIVPAALANAQDAPKTGASIYAQKCNACHSGAPTARGPAIKGVAGKNIATVAKGYEYSEGLKAKTAQKWTDANLDAFLTAPRTFAPGTKMVSALTDPADRAMVIAHLKTLK